MKAHWAVLMALILPGAAAATLIGQDADGTASGQGTPPAAATMHTGAPHGHGATPVDPLALTGLFPTPEEGVQAQRRDTSGMQARFVGDYAIRFECPPVVEEGEVATAAGCPSYILDNEDVMSQPVLSVDPKEPLYLAFNALHGGPGVRTQIQEPAPSGHSRDNGIHQPHTTFISTNGGSFWNDYRYPAPESLSGNYDEVFGEDNAMTRDHRGHFHVGSVYALRHEGQTEHVVALFKLGRASEPPDYLSYVLRRAEPGYVIQDISMDYVRDGRSVFAAWLETPIGGQGRITLLHQDIDARTSTWKPQAPAERIEGCTGITNAVQVDGDVWIGCFAGEDFDPEPHIRRHLSDPNATYTVPEWEVGQLQIFRIDGKEWTSHYVGPAPVTEAINAVLGSAENIRKGAMFIAGAGAQEGRTVATVTYGIFGQQWTKLNDYGPGLTGAGGSENTPPRVVVDARVTAAAFTADSGTVHMIVAERYAQSDSASPSEREFYKAYAAVHYTGNFLGFWALDIGAVPTYVSPQVSGLQTDLYMDRHDSIVMHKAKNGHERIFVAYGDIGWIRFAEVVEDNPTPPGFLLNAPPQIIAAPIAAGNAALVGAAAGVLSLSMVARMLAHKKKSTAEAPSL